MIDPENRVIRLRKQLMRIHHKLTSKLAAACPVCGMPLTLTLAYPEIHHTAHAEAGAPAPEAVPDHVPDSWTEGGK